MADFRMLDYHTEYSCRGDLDIPFNVKACFSAVYNHIENMHNYYTIRAYKGLGMVEIHRNNSCFLTKKEVEHHLNVCKKIFPFKYSIEEGVSNRLIEYYDLHVEISGENIIHRFILCWIRYLYEWPSNVYLLHLKQLKEDLRFKRINSINLMNVIGSYHRAVNGLHSLNNGFYLPKIFTIDQLKEIVPEGIELNSIFDTNIVSGEDIRRNEEIYTLNSFRELNLIEEYYRFYKKCKNLEC